MKQQGLLVDGKLRNMASVYLFYQGRILLLYRQGSKVANQVWVASAGGHFEEHELNDARACVLRELYEELAITEERLENLCLRYVTLRGAKGEIRQNYYFFAELKGADELQLSSDEGTLKWFSMDELAQLEMPFSAQFVLEHYMAEGRYTDAIYGGVANGEKVVFTELVEF